MTDELYHFGVKGMKWGVRQASNTINRARNVARGAQFLRKIGL